MSELEAKPKPESKLKKLTSGSTWVSPFRSGGEKVNLRQQFKEQSSIDKINVPKKFATHPTLEAEKKREEDKVKAEKKKAEEEAEAKAKAENEALVDGEEDEAKPEGESAAITSNASVQSVKGVPIDTPAEPAEEAEEEKAEETADAEDAEAVPETEIPAETEKEAEPETENETKPEVAEEAAAETSTEKTPAEFVAEVAAGPEPSTELEGDETDNIVERVKEEPIEIVTQPEYKYEPVEPVNKELLEKLQDKPVLLEHYHALNASAVGSVSRALDDPNKVIDLGSGLKMTQQQLLDIAAKRVAPVLANINDEVTKTRSEDEIKRQQDLATKVASHEKKLQGEFDKHVKKLGKIKEKFNKEIDLKLLGIAGLMTASTKESEDFETTTRGEIETAQTEYKDREEKAVEKHATDKETLLKNHDELEATKKQELEDSKTNQETTTTEIEELQERKTTLDDENSDLASKIEELTAKYNAKFEELTSLKTKHSEKEEGISKNLATREEIEAKLAKTKEETSVKQTRHEGLSVAVGALSGAVAAYAAKLASLRTEKDAYPTRLTEAKGHFSSWEQEKQSVAKQVALDHERQRLAAKEEEETKRVKAQEEAETKRIELELERQRLKEEEEVRLEEERLAAEKKEREDKIAAEKKAEEDKIAAEKKAEEDKIAAEKREEEEKIAAEKAEKEAEEEKQRIALQPEYQRQERAKQREDEKKRLIEEREEKERLYFQRKEQEETEAAQLQQEIEELNKQKDLKAQEARVEAERQAQAKLDEIDRLKAEHDERLKLYQERLDFEELQKTRLLEEVDNLKKIRELREEKSRLALEVNRDVRLDDIQKLIEERELEVARLSKQIELDDHELYKQHKKEPSTSSSVIPVPQIKNQSSNSPVAALENKERTATSKKSVAPVAAATGAAAAGLAAAGIGAGAASSSTGAAAPTLDTKPRSGSITKSIKRLSQKFKSSPESPTKPKAKEVEPAAPATSKKTLEPTSLSPKELIDLKKQPSGVAKLKAQVDKNESTESLIVYEEVSDKEFEANKNHPDYLEISHEEYEKNQEALAKAKGAAK